MMSLFDADYLSENPDLVEVLHGITERHARELVGIPEISSRADAARLAWRDDLSVRELSNVVGHLRGWFGANGTELKIDSPTTLHEPGTLEDYNSIRRIIGNEFLLPHKGDFEGFRKMHLFERGFNLYSGFPPLKRLENKDAIHREAEWFHRIARNSSWHILKPKIDIFHNVAVVTFVAEGHARLSSRYRTSGKLRVTLVMLKRMHSWKIFHEHWSEISDHSRYFLSVVSQNRNGEDGIDRPRGDKSVAKRIPGDTSRGPREEILMKRRVGS